MTETAPRFFTEAMLADTFDFGDRLQGLRPVVKDRSPDGRRDVFVVTGYEEVTRVQLNPEIFSNNFGSLMMGAADSNQDVELNPDDIHAGPILITRDDPEHRRYRELFNPIFSPAQADRQAPRMKQIIDELLDAVIEQGACDFLNEIAVPYPLMVISEVLGIDRGHLHDLRRWSDAVIELTSGHHTEAERARIENDVRNFSRFLNEQLEDRRRRPGSDAISQALAARVSGIDPLSPREIALIVREMIIAGNESTRNTLTGGLVMLLRRPDIIARLKQDSSLIPAAVEELVRLTTVVSGMWRIATRDTKLGEVDIPRGAAVMIRMDAANRDPAHFSNPDQLTLDRPNQRRHVGFGQGIHMCLGNRLARKELAVAFERILARMHNIEIDAARSDLASSPHVFIRGAKALAIKFTPGGRLEG